MANEDEQVDKMDFGLEQGWENYEEGKQVGGREGLVKLNKFGAGGIYYIFLILLLFINHYYLREPIIQWQFRIKCQTIKNKKDINALKGRIHVKK